MTTLTVSPGALRRARERAGLTQEQAAYAAGLTRATVQNMERGRPRPAAYVIASLARVYGVPMESLFTHDSNGTGDRETRKQKNRPTPVASRR